MVFDMKYYVVVIASLINSVSVAQAQVPDQMTPSQQLVAACKAHPQHEICVKRQAKSDKAKASRDAKTMASVELILASKPTH